MKRRDFLPVVFVLTCSVLASCGPDLFPSREDVRDNLSSCAQREITTEARTVMCTALLRETQKVNGPVTVLSVGSELFEKSLASRGIALKDFLNDPLSTKYARAHIFNLSNLSTGQLTSLDGVSHKVECNASSGVCRVDDLIEGGTDGTALRYTGGKIYAMNGLLPF